MIKIKKNYLFWVIFFLFIYFSTKKYPINKKELKNASETFKIANKTVKNISNVHYNIDIEKIINIKQESIDDYKKLHNNILKGILPLKVVINRNTHKVGYANKLYSFLSSLLSAILTDSALVVIWPDIDQFIEEPLESSFNENAFNLSNILKNINEGYLIKPSLNWQTNKNMIEISNTTLPNNQTIYIYQDIRAYFFELSSNPTYFKSLHRYGLVSKETLILSTKSLSNKSMSSDERNENILKVGFEVGSNLLSLFWKPLRTIQEKIDEVVRKEFIGNYVIGIQLRYEFLSAEDTQVFIDCAIQIENQLEHNTNFNKNNIKWFITSDLANSFGDLQKRFGRKVFFLNNSLGHIDFGTRFYERAIMDVELLSKCDELIVTGGSTFGFIASIKAKRLPFYLNGKMGMKHCEQMSLNKPSFREKTLAVF